MVLVAPEINMVNIKNLAENGKLYLEQLEERRKDFILQSNAEQAALVEQQNLLNQEKSPEKKNVDEKYRDK